MSYLEHMWEKANIMTYCIITLEIKEKGTWEKIRITINAQ